MSLESRRIAIIGAGMTGLTCAHHLTVHAPNADLVIFEKSRGIGGRMATRRAGVNGELSFDHGAQYIRSRNGAFSELLDQLEREGTVGAWTAGRRYEDSADDPPLYVGVPAMNDLLRPLASRFDLRKNTQITSMARGQEGWLLSDETGLAGTFDHVVVTTPADQVRSLLALHEDIVTKLQHVEIWPCWSLMIALESPIDCTFDQWRYVSPEIGWLTRNSSKPQRGAPECWVMHARPEWSIENLERSKDDICQEMLAIFRRLMTEASNASLPAVTHAQAHRWRYAQTGSALGEPFVESQDGTLLVGGDWTLGARVECAFESGAAMAQRLIGAFGEKGDAA